VWDSDSEQATVLEVILYNDISDGVKHKLDISRVGGACEVSVNLFSVFLLVERLELHLNISGCLLKRVRACERKETTVNTGSSLKLPDSKKKIVQRLV